jgi:hypothetical protein
VEEWLYSYPEKKKRVLFERLDGRIRFGSTLSSERAKLDVLYELTRPNALFFSVAAQSESELVPVYRWFHNGVTLRSSDDHAHPALRFLPLAQFLADHPERRASGLQ